MRVRPLSFATIAVGAIIATASSANAKSLSPEGVWIDHTGRGAVEIKRCGKRLCGRVVWTRSKKDSKKGCGKQIIGNLKRVSSKTWDGGWIYSPERGQRYDLEIKPISENKLRILGYLGSKIFSKTMYWKRAPADLARCDQPEAAPDAPIIAKKKQPAPQPSALGGPDAQDTGKKKSSVSASKQPAVETQPAADKPAKKKAEPAEEQVASRDTDNEADNSDTRVDRLQRESDDAPNVDEDASANADDDYEDEERQTATNSKKRCTFRAPFVVVTFPCPN